MVREACSGQLLVAAKILTDLPLTLTLSRKGGEEIILIGWFGYPEVIRNFCNQKENLDSNKVMAINVVAGKVSTKFKTRQAQAVEDGVNETVEFGITADEKAGLLGKIWLQGEEFS